MSQIMNMRKGYMLIICLGIASLLFGADDGEKKSKMARLGKMKMEDVVAEEGFEYFSGHLDTAEIPRNLLTIYQFKNIGAVPKLRIIGNDISVDFPVSRIDQALEVYKLLVLQKVTSNQKERDRISRELEKYRKLK